MPFLKSARLLPSFKAPLSLLINCLYIYYLTTWLWNNSLFRDMEPRSLMDFSHPNSFSFFWNEPLDSLTSWNYCEHSTPTSPRSQCESHFHWAATENILMGTVENLIGFAEFWTTHLSIRVTSSNSFFTLSPSTSCLEVLVSPVDRFSQDSFYPLKFSLHQRRISALRFEQFILSFCSSEREQLASWTSHHQDRWLPNWRLHPETVLFEEFSLLPPAVLLLVGLLLFLSRRPFRLLGLSFNEVLRLCEVYWFWHGLVSWKSLARLEICGSGCVTWLSEYRDGLQDAR